MIYSDCDYSNSTQRLVAAINWLRERDVTEFWLTHSLSVLLYLSEHLILNNYKTDKTTPTTGNWTSIIYKKNGWCLFVSLFINLFGQPILQNYWADMHAVFENYPHFQSLKFRTFAQFLQFSLKNNALFSLFNFYSNY